MKVDARFHGHHPQTASELLAALIPEFGGAFIDDGGVLNIYVTDNSVIQGARLIVAEQLRRQGRSQLPVRFVPGKFSYAQLSSFVDALRPSLGPSSVASVWIDEWTNRLRIGYVSSSARPKIQRVIAQLHLPLAAIVLEPGEFAKVTTTHDLNDFLRPILGGISVGKLGTNSRGTLAGLVTTGGQTYALVSSHVVDTQGNGSVGDAVVQPALLQSQIGTVAVNPRFESTIAGCPQGARCRTSDAALVALYGGTTYDFTSLASPFGGPAIVGPGSTTFDDGSPMHIATDGVTCQAFNGCSISYYPGDTASKVGVTTGWTGGKYLGLAAWVTGADGLTRLNNIMVEGVADEGDSGGPIIAKARNQLIGVVWGKGLPLPGGKNGFYGSTWPSVSQELAGTEYALHDTPPHILGYEQHMRHDSGCPDNPDAQNYYLITGYPDGSGFYEVTQSSYMGHTTYYCGFDYVNADYQQSAGWQACAAYYGTPYDCPCAMHAAGNSECTTFDP